MVQPDKRKHAGFDTHSRLIITLSSTPPFRGDLTTKKTLDINLKVCKQRYTSTLKPWLMKKHQVMARSGSRKKTTQKRLTTLCRKPWHKQL